MSSGDSDAQHILVALDASPQSLAALGAAATLARLLQAELHGIFVEDKELEKLCSLPFSAEIGAYSATARALSSFCISREFHALEDRLRLVLQSVAQSAGVEYSLQVARGGVSEELLNAADDAIMVGLGRIGWSQRSQWGSTASILMRRARRPLLLPGLAQRGAGNKNRLNEKSIRQDTPPQSQLNEVKVLYTGTDAADRALILGHQLTQTNGHPLVAYMLHEPFNESANRDLALSQARIVTVASGGTSHILAAMQASQPGITLLPDIDAYITLSLLSTVTDPVLLIS